MQRILVELLRNNAAHADAFQSRFDDLQETQHPDAVTVCCSDSRVLQNHMWGDDVPGHLFTCSNIGNRVVQRTGAGETVSGDVLYPVCHTGTELVVVVGHTGCGAITAAYDDLTGGVSEPPGIRHCLSLLEPHLETGIESLPPGVDRAEAINRLVEYNVDRQVEHLETSDEVPDAVTTVGVVYDFQDIYSGRRGEIHVVNVDGERRVDRIGEKHPEIGTRVERLWEY
jgi:carbonic anhydrase